MYQPLYVHIRGIAPQLQNNGQRKDPLNRWAKAIARISKKRTKTDDDHMAMREAEFKGSLYCRDDREGRVVYWPADNIHACIKTAAKMKKQGKVVDTAVVVGPNGGQLIYDGPRTRDELWEAGDSFRLLKPTKRGVMSCRPCFHEWEVKFSLHYLETLLGKEDIVQLIKDAGAFIGLSDWPRRYGLFKIEDIQHKEVEIDVE